MCILYQCRPDEYDEELKRFQNARGTERLRMSSYRNPPGSGGAPMTPTGSGNVSQRNASRSPTPAGRGSPSAGAVSGGASKGQQGGGGQVNSSGSSRYKPQPISPERGTSHRSFEDSTTDGVLSKQVDLRDSLNRKSESRRLAYSQQVWPLTQFFSVSLL